MATTHIVRQGECLSSIAHKHGFSKWRTIYNHPKNADFKKQRPNPNLIYPGDEIFIPDKDPRQESRGTDKSHKFVKKAPLTLLRIVLLDEKRKPLAGKKYKLVVGKTTHEKSTGGDGLLQHPVPPDLEEALLTVWPNDADPDETYTFALKIGHLDPVKHITGFQARLNNLGFYCGSEHDEIGPRTTAALRAFQEEYRSTTRDGTATQETMDDLKEAYGC